MLKFERLPADILLCIPKIKEVLLKDDNIIFAYLFGSLAKGNVKPLSDVDVAVYVRNTANCHQYKFGLFSRLADAIGTGEIDLIILNATPLSMACRVLQNKQILVDKEPFRRHIYESVILRESFDFKLKEDAILLRRYGIGR